MCCRLESSWDQRGSCAGSLTATLLAASPAAPLSQALLPPVGSAWRDSSSSRVCKVPSCIRQLFAPNTASSRSSRYSFRLRICQEHRVALEVRSHGQEQPERFCQASRLLPGSWDHETSLLPQPLNASQHRSSRRSAPSSSPSPHSRCVARLYTFIPFRLGGVRECLFRRHSLLPPHRPA